MGDIAVVLSADFLVPDLTAKEVLYVRRGGSGPDANARELVELGTLVESRLISVVRLRTAEEIDAFVELAVEMHDGEAAACALAICHKAVLLTDDRKARRIMRRLYPAAKIMTTAEIIREWAERCQLDNAGLSRVIRDVEERAAFRPGPQDPLEEWWDSRRDPH
ncbi:MAG: hypothetical protein HYX92_11655 [Chloroflexi bacterium]|nr:hypothetical protein [Chloroflexota bacterium]